MDDKFIYREAQLSQISFPLGGIGTGCIGLSGNGRLIDWEIFNRPNKGHGNGFTHFAVRTERDGEVIDARVLQGPLAGPYEGDHHTPTFRGHGFGPDRETLAGLPHFRGLEFEGTYPIATLRFSDDRFPGEARLRAFNPFIPGEPDDSGIPAAFLEYEIENTTPNDLTYVLVGSVNNPVGRNNLNTVPSRNLIASFEWGNALHLTADRDKDLPGGGDVTLATDAGLAVDIAVSYQHDWYRGTWFDSLEVYWNDLTVPGPFTDRRYDQPMQGMEFARNSNEGLLAVHVPIPAGGRRSIRFALAWSFPIFVKYWHQGDDKPTWPNYYAGQFADSTDAARHALQEWDRLLAETELFRDALFASTLPTAALDAVSANLSTLKTPTVMRLEDGTIHGWEGLRDNQGCCEGSCTHVWNYQQSLPFLFSGLERTMRDADYTYNLLPSGGMPFRIQLPLGSPPDKMRPCVDGQMGGVMKTYRDWKLSGDDDWLQAIWPKVKRSLEYAWSPDNADRWDPDRTGVIWGRQHHTLDMELFGPTSWLTGFYLGALKAAAAMAEYLDDPDGPEYQKLYENGRRWVEDNLFNGEYYIQQIDLDDIEILESFVSSGDVHFQGIDNVVDGYWDHEHSQIKYQLGEGCSIDQISAQWHASLYGLGEVLDPEQVKCAAAAIMRHNFVAEADEVANPCRVYSLNDEAGLVIAAWPDGTRRPVIPIVYAQETMNGYEYAAGIHMIMLGMVEEGMRCIAAIRDRYDGRRRNPWNEFECGSNYARSMASYALLNAFSGLEFDMVAGHLGFRPVARSCEPFKCLWSLGPAWGTVSIDEGEPASIHVHGGTLTLTSVRIGDRVTTYPEPQVISAGECLLA